MEPLKQVDLAKPKQEIYTDLCEQLQNLLGQERDLIANAANTAALLFHSLPDVNWVGFYFTDDEDQLLLGPFQGKPACARIAIGSGVCGTAASTQESVIVPDVTQFEGHIVCDPASASEIVVPLLNWGNLIGVLDVDSEIKGRFDEDDQEGLEMIASVLVASLESEDMPDLSDEAAEE
jgi:GAF domain-containing protein